MPRKSKIKDKRKGKLEENWDLGGYRVCGEDSVVGSKKILFPRVQSCQTVICVLQDNRLVATHLTMATSKFTILDCIEKMNEQRKNTPIESIYLVGTYEPVNDERGKSFESWSDYEESSRFRWPKMIETFKELLDKKCPFFVFDKGAQKFHLKVEGTGGGTAIFDYQVQRENEWPDMNAEFNYLQPNLFVKDGERPSETIGAGDPFGDLSSKLSTATRTADHEGKIPDIKTGITRDPYSGTGYEPGGMGTSTSEPDKEEERKEEEKARRRGKDNKIGEHEIG